MAKNIILLLESDGFTFRGGRCYYISTEMKTWDQSRQWCRDRQSDLIVIKSKEKQVLYSLVERRIHVQYNVKYTVHGAWSK